MFVLTTPPQHHRLHPPHQCEKYLTQKQSEFAVRLVELINTARSSIEALWNEMRLSATERATAFAPFFAPVSAFEDDIFLAHEEYIARATVVLEEMRPILRAIEKRDALLADKVEYEAIIADAARLIKGSSAARLREEKLEKRVKKELPAYNKRLRVQIAEFEVARGGAPFTIDGARFLDVLDSEEMAEAKARGDARAQREARQRGDEEVGSAAAAPTVAAATEKASSRANSNPRATVGSVARAPLSSSAAANASGARPTSAKIARPSAPPPAPQPLPAASASAEHVATQILSAL